MTATCIWPTGNWNRRKIITPQTANMDAALTDFPLLVKFTSDAAIGKWAHATGQNLRFAAPDGSLLKYERLSFSVLSNQATGVFYVKRSLDPSGDNRIQVLYDNSGAGDGQDKNNVWTGQSHLGVWHFSEDPSGSSPQVLDSTSNANHGTANGSMPSGALVTGPIFKALTFDGSNDNIQFGDDPFDFGSSDFFASLWFKTGSHSGYACLISKENGWGTHAWNFVLDQSNGHLRPLISNGTWNFTLTDSADLSDNAWHHVLCQFDRDGNLTSVIDGVSTDPYDISGAVSDSMSNANQMRVGSNGSATGNWVNGLIAGVRVGTGLPGVAWAKFEFHNGNESDNELDWSAEEVRSARGMMSSV